MVPFVKIALNITKGPPNELTLSSQHFSLRNFRRSFRRQFFQPAILYDDASLAVTTCLFVRHYKQVKLLVQKISFDSIGLSACSEVGSST